MPMSGYSVGRDISLTITTPTGDLVIQPSSITKFDAKQETTSEDFKALDGITRHLRYPNGWKGSFDLKREGGAVDAYFAAREQGYYDGVEDLPCSITETILEPGGAISQFVYKGVFLTFDDAGSWEGQKSVNQKIGFVAERRIQQS